LVALAGGARIGGRSRIRPCGAQRRPPHRNSGIEPREALTREDRDGDGSEEEEDSLGICWNSGVDEERGTLGEGRRNSKSGLLYTETQKVRGEFRILI